MTPIRPVAWAAVLVIAVPAVAEQPAEPPRPRVVLRISRAFVESLTRGGFNQVEPIAATEQGAAIAGSAQVAGNYSVVFNKSQTETTFDLRVSGQIDTQLGVIRRPVRVRLDGHAPFTAVRRVSSEGNGYVGAPVGVGACYASELDDVTTLRRGPLARLVRRVARPIVLRALPEADRAATGKIGDLIRDAVSHETDEVIGVLTAVHEARVDVTEVLRRRGLNVSDKLSVHATTEDSLLAGIGFPPGEPPTLPAAAGRPSAPIEFWVNQALTPDQVRAIELAKPELQKAWDARVKPRLVEQLTRHSPVLAKRLEAASHEVEINFLPGAPGWHRIRFFKELHDAPAGEPAAKAAGQ